MIRFFKFIAFFIFLLGCNPAQANNIRELRAMDFGVFTIVDSGAHSIVVAPNGNTTTPDGGIHKLRGGRAGQFQITGIDPTVLFYITVDPVTITHTNGSPAFDIDGFTFDPPNNSVSTIHTDPDGSLVVNTGATLHVSAGTPITPGAYRGTYNFMINF